MSLARPSSKPLSLHAGPVAPGAAAVHPLADRGFENPGTPTCAGVNSTDLLRGQKAVDIQHNGLTYRLQATRLGKLILTK